MDSRGRYQRWHGDVDSRLDQRRGPYQYCLALGNIATLLETTSTSNGSIGGVTLNGGSDFAGTIRSAGNSGGATIPGNLVGSIELAGNLTGQISISGDISGAATYSVSVAGNLGRALRLLATGTAAFGAGIRVSGEFDGSIRVGSGGSGLRNVTIGTTPAARARCRL